MALEWLLPIGLLVWVWIQSGRIITLQRELEGLKREFAALRRRLDGEEAQWTPQPANEQLPELLLTDVVEAAPAPAEPAAPVPDEEPAELLLTEIVPAEEPKRTVKSPRKPRSRQLEKWITENAFAWIAAVLFAVGGALLVQQSFFTPPLRLGAALLLGAALIGASEWVRSLAERKPYGHPLVAALLAGAGASTLYAAAWGAHGIYHFIDWPLAALALALCAAILLGLSFVHGQALGAIAIAAALIAPQLATLGAWPPAALALYLGAVCISGFVVSALRRWGWVAATITLGAYVWYALLLADGATTRALAMLAIAAVGATALSVRPPESANDEQSALAWPGVHAFLPTLGIGVSAILTVLVWDVSASNASQSVAGPSIAAIFLVALAALAVREGAARPAVVPTAITALAVGALAFARASRAPLLLTDFYPWTIAAAGVVALSALAASQRSKSIVVSAFGAFGALALLAIGATAQPVFEAPSVWGPLLVGAVLLFAIAQHVATSARDPTQDRAVDFWAGAGALAFLFALESLAPMEFLPAADALAALAFAALALRRGWPAATMAAMFATLVSLAHIFSPAFAGSAWSGEFPIRRVIAVLVVAAAAEAGAGWLVRRREPRAQAAEALEGAAIITALAALFLGLRYLASGPTRLDFFTEDALRALCLIIAGYFTLPHRGRTAGFIARWRGHVLMAAGLGYGAFTSILVFNPWWGAAPAHIPGAPLFNAHIIAFAAPAALAFFAANQLYGRAVAPARLYAGAGALFAVCWAVLEVRRAFHGADLRDGAVGLLEGDSYGLAALIGACALGYWSRYRAQLPSAAIRPFTQDLSRILGIVAVIAVLASAYFLMLTRNAWWGDHNTAQTDAFATGLATFAHAPAATLSLLIGMALPKRTPNCCFVTASAASLYALGFGFLLIRWIFHGALMDDLTPMRGAEGLLYAVWPLAFLVGGVALTVRFAHRDTLRALSLDLAAIWSVAIWPALAYSAFGLWAMFNPWRGFWPAQLESTAAWVLGLACYVGAPALCLALARMPIIRRDPLFPNAARITAAMHLFAALMLVVRRGFHGPDMATENEASMEMWVYSATWALFGAGVLAWGAWRRDAVLRWTGLALLLGVTVKVFLIDMAQLNGIVRIMSLLGVGAVLVAVALASRRIGVNGRTARLR